MSLFDLEHDTHTGFISTVIKTRDTRNSVQSEEMVLEITVQVPRFYMRFDNVHK